MKQKLLFVLATLIMSVMLANAASRSISGIVGGFIIRTRMDVGGLFSIWLKVDGKMHEFMVQDAQIVGGDQSTLVAGVLVRIQYSNLEHSEMDDFFTAKAVTVTVLNKGKNRP